MRCASQEVLLVRRLVVGVAGREHHAFDAELHHLVEESAHAVGIGAVEERGVGGDAEAAAAPLPASPSMRDVVSAFAADGEIVMLALAVHVDGERQILARLEEIDLLFQQQRVGAQVDVLLARDQALDDLVDLRMHQRLAAGNGDHRRAALVHRAEAFLRREVLLEHVRRILDFAAAGARQVAAKQRLQHQHQRIALAAPGASASGRTSRPSTFGKPEQPCGVDLSVPRGTRTRTLFRFCTKNHSGLSIRCDPGKTI